MGGFGEPDKIGLRFSEKMSGYLAEGKEDFEEGERSGREQDRPLSFQVTIGIEDVGDFCKLSRRKAVLEGAVSYAPLGQNLPIRKGKFSLFRPDRETGKRHMTYSFAFTGADGNDYFLHGYKIIYDDPRKIDLVDDLTRLFTRIHRGSSAEGPLFGSGILHFDLMTLPAMLASFEITHTHSLIKKLKAISAFYSFCYGEVRDTYLRGLSPVYRTEYENLVLSGKLTPPIGEAKNFFFFSGVHDKDFPWGDDEIFWDVALIIQKADTRWAKYILTDRIIEGLELDVKEGTYRYEGPIYQVLEGHQLWRSELQRPVLPKNLRRIQAKIEIRFDSKKFETVNLPFSLISDAKEIPLDQEPEEVKEWLPHLQTLGLHLTPHKVKVRAGKIMLEDGPIREEHEILVDQTIGEAEKSTFTNIRWPKLYYNYFCALNPSLDEVHVKIRTDVLRGNRKDIVLDKVQEGLGKLIHRAVSLDLVMTAGTCRMVPAEQSDSWSLIQDDLLEINNDHFPTAVFQRRVVALKDSQGQIFYSMEEDMDTLNLGALKSDRVVKAAAIKGSDKYQILDEVLEKVEFVKKLEEAWERSGKKKEDFAIMVKPNFMFMYSTRDPSTYTDPQLIEHLLNRIYEQGYRNLACAEARSTYGTFFTNREVKTVGRHIGLAEKNYRIVDLSEDLEEYSFAGKLGNHFVNREWKNADFRIIFAKNKTHSYAFYTLAIKCVYGALPMEDKFLEYHHNRDIFSTTIEFLRHFPVHFALIDAYISADGPFGIFADKNPNQTQTLIGSEDVVAADWIGASKMGLDPMVSDYMKLAVEAFGKPQIRFIGDRSLYPNWVNVTDVIPLFAFGFLDRDYYFGNLFYSLFAYMEDFFQYKDPRLGLKIARILADPIKSIFFQKAKEGKMDKETLKKFYDLLTGKE